jgi:hypothetical protein
MEHAGILGPVQRFEHFKQPAPPFVPGAIGGPHRIPKHSDKDVPHPVSVISVQLRHESPKLGLT